MDFLHILILALLQALTEFLPISSSGHLVLASELFGWDYQGLSFDLALHFGTLLAVLVYFRRDVWELVRETLAWRPGQRFTPTQRLASGITLATIPAGLAGLALGDAGAMVMRHPVFIAVNLIVFGVLLWLADRRSRRTSPDASTAANVGEEFNRLTLPRAVLIGCAQALALMPGVSRSGATMTAGLFLGLDRARAARFSFLLSIPVMVLATAHAVWETRHAPLAGIGDMLLGAAIAAVAGWFVIHFFLGVIRRIGTGPFVLYRVLLGVFVLGWYFL
ncbi:undecaprenyl-diphosphate phosphatase [Xanthomonadaceae bacterium JHOS43]|nr:undecaprenyl-diphosphate phosphatase [Xanthomonadaceae bacterium JHOS43]MCX7561978.1 undecaprenyl-diphosphate phosphatase [Xanthomonadaceae bacterium XH05]